MVKETLQKRKETESKKYLLVNAPKLTAPVIAKINQINNFGKKRLIDKFYEGDNEIENVQGPENNKLSDNEKDCEVSDFLSSEDTCNEWLP